MPTEVLKDISQDTRISYNKTLWEGYIAVDSGPSIFVHEMIPVDKGASLFVHERVPIVAALYDANMDVRFAYATSLSDVHNDIRITNQIPVRQDFKTDFRMAQIALAHRDIVADIRTHKVVISDIKGDVRFADKILVYKDVHTDIRYIFGNSGNIRNDFRTKKIQITDFKNDFRTLFRAYKDIRSDVRFFKVFTKDFYGMSNIVIDSTKDLYGRLGQVTQPVPTIPVGVTGTDKLKGDLIQLDWTDDSNYGYNVYRTNPGGRLKMNAEIITNNYYQVGNLVEDTAYTFVVVGVNGVGTESADSLSVVVTPTFPDFLGTDPRVYTHTIVVKINNVTRADAILDTIEIGYGTSPAIARFKIPTDPLGAGLPGEDDSVECIVNGKSIFKGLIKVIDKSISGSGLTISYTAFSKLILQNNYVVDWGTILANLRSYNIDVSDQTYLQATETVYNKLGNYRLFYDMQTDTLIPYKLGTGTWNRTVAVGKNIISLALSNNTQQRIRSITIRGARKKTITQWMPLDVFTTLGPWVSVAPMVWWRSSNTAINAFNISEIQIQGLGTDGQPEYEFDSSVSIVPSDVSQGVGGGSIATWQDGTVEPKQKVIRYSNPNTSWQSVGTKIDYRYELVGNDSIPVEATIRVTGVPVQYFANTSTGYAVRKGREGHPEEDVDFGWVRWALPHWVFPAPLRVSYAYEDRNPVEVSSGSGTPSRSITDSSYAILVDKLNGTDNTTEVMHAMSERANAELARVNNPVINGNIVILGDENFNLRTMLNVDGNMLDVLRIVHSFANGFTTALELTNEKFRVNIPSYSEQRQRVENERKIASLNYIASTLANKINQANATASSFQESMRDIQKSPFAIYGV